MIDFEALVKSGINDKNARVESKCMKKESDLGEHDQIKLREECESIVFEGKKDIRP
jgi:hypothetical protein